MTHRVLRPFGRMAGTLSAIAVLGLALTTHSSAAARPARLPAFPGGFVEKATSGEIRPRLDASTLQRLIPARGRFTFPAPWNTEAVRITSDGDCGGEDCVVPVGYSYWRNMNNHVGSDTMLIFLGLDASHGGPTLFKYNKVTEQVNNAGPLFDSTDPLSWSTGEGWYFSATMPNALYVNSGSRMYRYDVVTRRRNLVYDAAGWMGSGVYIWQMHSSDDDRVHVATVRDSSSTMMGCLAYREDARSFSFHPAMGRLDECHVDKGGRYLIMLDNVDGSHGEDNRIIDLATGRESIVMDEDGAAGHADTGYGYIVNEDNWNAEPGAVRLTTFGTMGSQVIYHMTDWGCDVGHIAHGNARAGVAPGKQYVCSSNATRANLPRSNEIVCYRLDTSMDVLVVAPVMTSLDASGGGYDYDKAPKGNLDVTGQYMLWTSNKGGNRLDAFVVKIPAHRLMGSSLAPDRGARSSSRADRLQSLLGRWRDAFKRRR
jgi:hypothetical protein